MSEEETDNLGPEDQPEEDNSDLPQLPELSPEDQQAIAESLDEAQAENVEEPPTPAEQEIEDVAIEAAGEDEPDDPLASMDTSVFEPEDEGETTSLRDGPLFKEAESPDDEPDEPEPDSSGDLEADISELRNDLRDYAEQLDNLESEYRNRLITEGGGELRYAKINDTALSDHLEGVELDTAGVPMDPAADNTWTLYLKDPHPTTWAGAKEDDVVSFLVISEVDKTGLLVAVLSGGTFTTPIDILPTGVNFESAAAESDSWDRNDQGANDGLTIRLQTRMSYDDTATPPVLYAYYREFKFDNSGKLGTISAETRVTIDDPEACI